MIQVTYTDENQQDHVEIVDLTRYRLFSDLLVHLKEEVGSTEDDTGFILGLYENDPDLFGQYLRANWWQSLPDAVRQAVEFMAQPDYDFGEMRSLEDADKAESELRTQYSKVRYFESIDDFFAAYMNLYPNEIVYEGKIPNMSIYFGTVIKNTGMRVLRNVAQQGDIVLLRRATIKTAAEIEETEKLVDTLKDVIDFNISEDGELDIKDEDDDEYDGDRTVYDPKRDDDDQFGEEYEVGKEEDLTDLDADFDWEFYDEMHPSKRNWPVRDKSILFDPAAITRYSVDFYMNVASAQYLRTAGTIAPGLWSSWDKGDFYVTASGIWDINQTPKKVASLPEDAEYFENDDSVPAEVRARCVKLLG